ncbi:MAG: S41 family peptidase [Chloroflexi bacterium]|nr:S41 family peptidase [Chloroflexota bacterium]
MLRRAFLVFLIAVLTAAGLCAAVEKEEAAAESRNQAASGIDPRVREIRQVWDCILDNHVSSPSPASLLKGGVNSLNKRSKISKWPEFQYSDAFKAASNNDWKNLQKILEKYFKKLNPSQGKYAYRSFISGMLDVPKEGVSFVNYLPDPNVLKARFEAGSGILIGKSRRDHRLTVYSVLPGAPAAKAGIRPSDVIVNIDGYKVQQEDPVTELQARLIGAENSKLKLTVARGEKKIGVRLARKKFKFPCYNVYNGTGGMCRIKFNYFPATAGDGLRLLSKTLDELMKNGTKGLILDLRGCTGDNYEGAVGMTAVFLDKGENYGIIKRRNGDKEKLYPNFYGEKELPLVILIDGTTSGAAEIMAGALSVQRKVPLVGDNTEGAACVQKEFILNSGDTVEVAVASLLTPDGKNISAGGIVPGYKVKMPLWEREGPSDIQLLKAKELLKKMLRK